MWRKNLFKLRGKRNDNCLIFFFEMLKHFLINLFGPHLTLLGNLTLLCSPNIRLIIQLMKRFSFTHIHIHVLLLSSQHMIVTSFKNWSRGLASLGLYKCWSFLLEQFLSPSATPLPLKCGESPFLGHSVLSMKDHALDSPWTYHNVVLQSSSTAEMGGASADDQGPSWYPTQPTTASL